MKGLQLRGYQSSDLDAMFLLDELCFAAAFRFPRAQMRRFAEAKYARVVIAEVDASLAGFGILHLQQAGPERIGYVMTIDVAPEMRRAGLGAKLMAAMEHHAAEEGCSDVALHVFTGNEAAIRFYEGLGYTRTSVARDFYGNGLDAWIYLKPLGPAGPAASSLA